MNINQAVFALKSLVKEVENDLKNQMKVEDSVPETDTESLHKLLDFTKKEMIKRPKDYKKHKIEKGKKLKTVKKSVDDLMGLLAEVGTYKAAAAKPGQSPSGIELAGMGATMGGAGAIQIPEVSPSAAGGDAGILAADEAEYQEGELAHIRSRQGENSQDNSPETKQINQEELPF